MKDPLTIMPIDLKWKMDSPKTDPKCVMCGAKIPGNKDAFIARINVKRRRVMEIVICSESCRISFTNFPGSVPFLQKGIRAVLAMKNLR